jgi:RimJ/RimL family protein N-acetyltransferase
MQPFTLRPFQDSDIDSLVKHANNPKIAANLTDAFPHPYSHEDGRRFIAMTRQNDPPTILAIVIDNEVCGAIGVHPQADIHRKSAECGYWLAEQHWGKGVMPEAIRQMVDYAFRTFDINRIYARPFSFNRASQRVLEKAGFTHEATLKEACFKNGEYCDELYYTIFK